MQTQVIPMKDLAELITLQLEKGGRAKRTVTGFSMRPMLHERRDSVVLIPVRQRQSVGDVILYLRENGQYVLHRIIAVEECGYICSGDNQAMREPVSHSQLLGVMESFTRKGKAYTVRSFGYRIYTAACVHLFFLRKCYLAVRRPLGRLCAQWKK